MAGILLYATDAKMRPWLLLLCAEILSASATIATLTTGQPPSIASDRTWIGLFALAALGSTFFMALYALSLHVLGGFSGAYSLRRAALTLTPILLGGLFAGMLGLAPDVADAMRILARLRLLLGIGLISVVSCVVWATVLWTTDEGRGWLHTIQFGKAPALYASLAVFLVMIASGGGHLYSADEWAVYAVTHSIATRGSLLVRDNDPYPLYQMGIRPVASSDDGQAGYSKWPLLQSVIAVPIYMLAQIFGSEPDRESVLIANGKRGRPLVLLLVGPAWAAAAAAAVVWLLRGAGYGTGTALVVAALMAFSTPWWPYSKTLLNVVPAGCLFLVGLGAAVRSLPGRWQWPLVAGVAAGLASAARYELLLLVVPLGFVVAARCWSVNRVALLRGAIVPLGVFAGAWAAVVAIAVLLPNAVARAHPLNFGYGGQQTLEGWSSDPHIGIYGILLSPGFGLLIYAPVLALAGLALVWMREDAPILAAVIAASVIGLIVFYGSFHVWQGGSTWGPRYLVTIVPLLCLPLAAYVKRNADNIAAMVVLAGLGLYGFLVNSLAVLFDFNRGWQNLWSLGASPWHIVWTPPFSLIGAHLRLLRLWYRHSQGSFDLYLAAHAGWLQVALLMAAVVLAVGLARSCYAPPTSPPANG